MSEQPLPSASQGEASITGLLRVINRWRRPFLLLALGLPFLTAVVMLLTSNKYTARGTILVEVPEGGMGADILSQITEFTGLPGQVPPTEMYLAILKSDRVAMAVIDSVDLTVYYDTKGDTPGIRREKTLRKLRKRTEASTDDYITINVTATDKSPRIASNIVNAYLAQLEEANKLLALSRARRTRQLVGEALDQTRAEVDSTRRRMQLFQERYGVFSIEKQTEGTLELIGTLQTELLAAQTKRDALRGFSSEGSSQLQNLELQIRALRSQIAQLVGQVEVVARGELEKTGEEGRAGSVRRGESFFLPLNELPGLAGEYAGILTDLKVLEAKYTVLATQLEQTKIEESQSIPSFEILDWARPPYEKSGPHRTINVLAALLGGILAGVLATLLFDELDRRFDAESRRLLVEILPGSVRDRFPRRRGKGGAGPDA
jgi:uncharacterized protein involved in exopolysaccharide biosynthesis